MDSFICKTFLDEFLESQELNNDVIDAVSYMVRNQHDTTEGLLTWDKYRQIADMMKLYDYIDDAGNVLSP